MRLLSDVRFYADALAPNAVVVAWSDIGSQVAVLSLIMSACCGMLWVVARREEKTRER